MIKIGITGGIGSGKSVVADLLEVYGIPVYRADAESKSLTDTSPCIRKRLIELTGPETYTPEGLNRPYLAHRIFSNPDLLQQVNAVIHPEVYRHYRTWTESQTSPITALESAILFESGFDRAVDVTLMVYAPKPLRIRRAMQRDQTTAEAVESRIANQLDDEIKKERATCIVYNEEKEPLIPQIERFLASLPDRSAPLR